jgi:hypothetical protein
MSSEEASRAYPTETACGFGEDRPDGPNRARSQGDAHEFLSIGIPRDIGFKNECFARSSDLTSEIY